MCWLCTMIIRYKYQEREHFTKKQPIVDTVMEKDKEFVECHKI